jgi:hypothetical protein
MWLQPIAQLALWLAVSVVSTVTKWGYFKFKTTGKQVLTANRRHLMHPSPLGHNAIVG